MKKILHVGKYFPPALGGIEQVVYDITSGLKNESYEQRVVCFNHIKITVREFFDDIDIYRIGFNWRFASQPISFSYYKILKKIFAEFSPDVVHLHLPNPLIATYVHMLISKKTKLILHWHSDIVKQKIMKFFYAPFERLILKRADIIIAATSYHIEYSKSLKPFKEKTVIIPFCVDTLKLENPKTLPKNPKQLFFLGRHVPYKGLAYLIKAAEFIDTQAKIVIGGDGPLTKKLQKMALPYSNIIFTGELTNEQVFEYFCTSSLFLFPSITKNEAFGIAMIEAMYCGLPVVSFAIPGSGVNWVNQHEITGFCVENKNVCKFANAVNMLLNDNELYAKMSTNAHKWASTQFLKKRFIQDIAALYEK